MRLETKRWFILLAGLAACLCQGVAYSSSIFMLPLGEYLKRPVDSWSHEWALIFSMSLAFLPVGMILSGRLADAGKTKIALLLGSVLIGLGLFLASFGNSVAWIAITFGLMNSTGCGCTYGTVIGAAIRWFPDKRGLASGLAVSAVGFGPVVIAPLANYLLNAYDVMIMFRVLGIGAFIIVLIAALSIKNPPQGFIPEGYTPPKLNSEGIKNSRDLSWTSMLKTGKFWLLYGTYVCGSFSGILINSLAAPIAIELAGFTEQMSKWVVMTFSIANASGRIVWGYISDKIGRATTLAIIFVLTAIAMFSLYYLVTESGFYLPLMIVIAVCFGGVLGIFPSLCTDSFGTKNTAVNYAWLFSAFSVAAIISPQAAAKYRALGEEHYPKAFLVAGVVAIIGLCLAMAITYIRRKKSAN